MTRTVTALAFAALLLPLTLSAQPPAAFRAPVTYRSCVETFAHACNMRDANGRTFGRAVPVRHCSDTTFAPDGTFALSFAGGIVDTRGRYRLEGSSVVLVYLDERGAVRERQVLPLTEGGSRLGGMERVGD